MATLDTSQLQIRTVFARTPQNDFIPSSFILIADGNGGTHWSSVSSILPISSFTTVTGNSGTPLYADLSNSVLRISTTGIQGLFESYTVPSQSTLMLSNSLPAVGVLQGSTAPGTEGTIASNITTANAAARFLQPVTGQSTLKYVGVGDLTLSTVTAQNAIFFYVSSYTAAGYSTISGETFAWRPTLASTLSTSVGRPSFTSTIGYNAYWTWGAALQLSTSGTDLYFSSMSFQVDSLVPYIDTSAQSSTKLHLDVYPSFFFPSMYGGTTPLVKEVSTYLQVESGPLGKRILNETIHVGYITSQQANNSLSNVYTQPITMQIDPYLSLLSNYTVNGGGPLYFTLMHRIVAGASNATSSGFSTPHFVDNLTQKTNSMFIRLDNQSPLLP